MAGAAQQEQGTFWATKAGSEAGCTRDGSALFIAKVALHHSAHVVSRHKASFMLKLCIMIMCLA